MLQFYLLINLVLYHIKFIDNHQLCYIFTIFHFKMSYRRYFTNGYDLRKNYAIIVFENRQVQKEYSI